MVFNRGRRGRNGRTPKAEQRIVPDLSKGSGQGLWRGWREGGTSCIGYGLKYISTLTVLAEYAARGARGQAASCGMLDVTAKDVCQVGLRHALTTGHLGGLASDSGGIIALFCAYICNKVV